jgi:RHS repeat-associated protein
MEGSRALYYSAAWQVIEERQSSVAVVQAVFSPVYLDAIVLRDRDTDANGTLEERLWGQQDANWNVTALLDGSGSAQERFVYDPFGMPSVLTGAWASQIASLYAWINLHQGGRIEAASGLYLFRNRDYSPTLDRWNATDPLEFQAGDCNFYRYVGNNPVCQYDPYGLAAPPALPSLFESSFLADPWVWDKDTEWVGMKVAKVQVQITPKEKKCEYDLMVTISGDVPTQNHPTNHPRGSQKAGVNKRTELFLRSFYENAAARASLDAVYNPQPIRTEKLTFGAKQVWATEPIPPLVLTGVRSSQVFVQATFKLDPKNANKGKATYTMVGWELDNRYKGKPKPLTTKELPMRDLVVEWAFTINPTKGSIMISTPGAPKMGGK